MMTVKTITTRLRKTRKEKTLTTQRKRLSKFMNACFKVRLN